MTPNECIVPIFAMDNGGAVMHFLGTGSFVEEHDLLLTADHVVRDWTGPLAIALQSNLSKRFPAQVVHRAPRHDLALLRVEGYRPPSVIKLAAASSISVNRLVVTFEYGTTITAGRNINISPATRIGNVTRQLNLQDRFGPAGDEALELSFPALRGASGAPVLYNDNFSLVGVIIANISYHLLPSQIESVLDQSNTLLEETKFMLPQAVAVNVNHVINMLSEFHAGTIAMISPLK